MRSTLLKVVAIATMVFPMVGSALSEDEREFLRHFLRPGPEVPRAFDITAYVTHPCHEIEGSAEEEECRELFGEFADLGEVHESGLLEQMLREMAMSPAENALPPEFMESTPTQVRGFEETGDETEAEQEVPATVRERDTRAAQIWALCGEVAGDDQDACYQDNLRLLHDPSIPVDGNVYYAPKER